MPTKLDRVQVLFKKDLFKKLKMIAKIERRSLSSMVGSIVEDAMKSKKYQALLSAAKANDLNSKVTESKSIIQELLQTNISEELDFDANSKLKKLGEIISLISLSTKESNKESINESNKESNKESLEEDLLLVEKALKPDGLLQEIELETDYKLNKMKVMLNKINNKEDLNV